MFIQKNTRAAFILGMFVFGMFVFSPETTRATYGHGVPYQGCMMEISKSANVSSAKVGETITYTINFKNTGSGNCTGGGVKVADILSGEVTYVSETHSDNVTAGYHEFGTYHAGSHVVYWNAATLVPGETGFVTVTVKVKERASCGDFTVENKAKITAYELNNFTKWIESNTVTTNIANACPVPAPTCTLGVNDADIMRGEATIINWTTTDATTVTIDNGIGALDAAGKTNISPSTTTTYTLTAQGASASVTCTATVVVREPEPTPLSCDAFSANPPSRTGTGPVTLSWGTTNADSVAIDNGVGTVDVDGTKEITVSTTTTYTLTATRGTETKMCTTVVTVTSVPVVTPRCDAFSASPTSVASGNSVTLTWGTTDATTVSIDNGVGSVDADGSRTVNPTSDTTYTLTGTSATGQTTSCQVSVDVESSGGGGGGGSSSPRCTLKASDTSIAAGERVTLSWKNARTNEILLKDNRGTTLVDTEKSADEKKYSEDEDSIIVTPSKTTTYTITAYRGSKKRTCDVEIKVEGVTVTSTRTTDPLVAGISLSRLPYTGFDAGPMLTTLFYVLLGLWALGVAYVLVVRKSAVTPAPNALRGTILKDMPALGTLEHTVVVPSMRTEATLHPEVSRMSYVPALLTPPRATPRHDVASTHAPQGYDAYYDRADVPVPNLPVGEPVGFEEKEAPMTSQEFDMLEARAHDARVLISTDALTFIGAHSKNELERTELLDTVIEAAKARYPKEDGWVVVNKEKILSLLK